MTQLVEKLITHYGILMFITFFTRLHVFEECLEESSKDIKL